MMLIVKRFLWGIATLGLLLAVFAFWVLGTENGLRWAVQQAPEIVQAESISGELSDLSFRKLQLTLGETKLKIDQGAMRWRPFGLLTKQVSIDSLVASGVTVELPPSPQTDLPYTPWQGLVLPVDIALSQATIQDIAINQAEQSLLTLQKISISAEIKNSVLTLQELRISDAENSASLAGIVDLKGQADGVVELSQNVKWLVNESTVAVSGSLRGTWSSLALEQALTSPWAATVAGKVDQLLSDRITWDTQLSTQSITEQMVMGEPLSLGGGEFKLDGGFSPAAGLSGLTLGLVGQISGGSAQFSQWRADTKILLHNNDLNVERLRFEQQDSDQTSSEQAGALSVVGTIQGVTSFLSQTNQALTQDPVALGTVDLSGNWSSLAWPLSGANTQVRSNGQFSVRGTSQNYSILATAEGESYDQPLSAEVDVVLAGTTANVKKIKLMSGASVLNASGTIDERLSLVWDLQSPNIGDFLNNANGALRSSGKLSGQRAAPTIVMQASSEEISFAGYSAQNLGLSANVALAESNEALAINLTATGIRQGQSVVANSFELSVDGRLKSHNIQVDSVLGNQATLAVKAKGGLVDNEWQGTLSTLSLDDPVLAEWRLQSDVALKLAARVFNVSQGCLQNGGQSICFEANSSPTETQFNTTMNSLDLENLNRFTELYDLTITGHADGKLSYVRKPQQNYGVIDGSLESRSGVLAWQDSSDGELSNEQLVFDLIRVDIKQTDTVSGAIDVSLSNSDQAKLEFNIDSALESATLMQAAARATASMNIADLSVLPTILLDSVALNGSLQGQAQLSGSLAEPKIIASALLSDARADIPELGLELQGLSVNVSSAGTSKIDIKGQLRSGSGDLKISGHVDFVDIKSPQINLSLQGKQLQLAKTSELDIVGDLDLSASLVNRLLDLQGSVYIDHAEIDYKLTESAIVVSNDVVLQGVEKQDRGITQRLKVTVDLGNKTHIRAKGLDADLIGKLLIFQEPGGILRADGQITVNNGRYRAYGQDLKIDQGKLIFSGGSIDDPSLNLNAEKVVDSVTAGVSVTGRAASPKLDLYSSPAMPDEDILSVLIFNKPVGNLAAQDGLTLLRIANSLRGDGTSSVTKVTEKLQNSLGLTSLELQLTNNAPSIVAGKQLSSKFYIGYGYGLLNAAQSVILRYNLNKAWSIKADLGADSGADLRYQLER